MKLVIFNSLNCFIFEQKLINFNYSLIEIKKLLLLLLTRYISNKEIKLFFIDQTLLLRLLLILHP